MLVEKREFSPKPFKYRRAIELCLVGFLTCFVGYSYLDRYWVPDAPEAPCPKLYINLQSPLHTFDDDVNTGYYATQEGFFL